MRPTAQMRANAPAPASANPDDDVFAEFAITYLTQIVNLDPTDPGPHTQRGLVVYRVYARHAEDAILRLRASEPIEHPIVEIASVQNTGNLSTNLILPAEWGVTIPGAGPVGSKLVSH